MIEKYTYKKMTWIDVSVSTRDEIRSVTEEYALPELLVDELLVPVYRSKVDRYKNVVYLVLHFPVSGLHKRKSSEQEVDFVVGKDFVITVHYEPVDALHQFAKLFEVNSVLDRGELGEHAGFLFYYIARELYKHAILDLEDIAEAIHDIEKNIFDGKESEMVKVISGVNRTLVDFRQAFRFHDETLTSFERAGTILYGEGFSYYLNAILGEYRKVEKVVGDQRAVLSDLRETNDSLLTAKTNDIITKLTIMNFIMLPLGLITWILAMDSEVTFIHTKTDFLLVLIIMALVGTLIFMYFRRKKWL